MCIKVVWKKKNIETNHCPCQKASDLFSYLSLLKKHALGRRRRRRKKLNFTPPGSSLFKGQKKKKKSKEKGDKSYFFSANLSKRLLSLWINVAAFDLFVKYFWHLLYWKRYRIGHVHFSRIKTRHTLVSICTGYFIS